MTFESELKKLEEIVEKLESGNVPLAELVKFYENGLSHLKNCREKLAEAEVKILKLHSVDADGNAVAEEFDGNDEK